MQLFAEPRPACDSGQRYTPQWKTSHNCNPITLICNQHSKTQGGGPPQSGAVGGPNAAVERAEGE